MKDFPQWNEIKMKTDESVPSIKIREGEIRWCRVGINIGNEVIGKGENFIRPVLILKKFSGDVFLGVPLTTKIRTSDWYFLIKADDRDRCAILNQARLFDRKRLQEKIFELSEVEIREIKEAYCKLILG